MNAPPDAAPMPAPALTLLEQRTLLPLLLAASAALVWILLPFYGVLLWGTVVALLFAPLYRRLLPPLAQRRTLAALLTLAVVLVAVVLPLALTAGALAREAGSLYERLQTVELNPARYFRGVFDALPGWITSWLDRFGLVDFDTLQSRLTDALAQASRVIATQALGLGQLTFEVVVEGFLTLYLAFFLIRDGDRLTQTLCRAVPLAAAHRVALVSTFTVVIRATVKGNVLVAALQGLLGGVAFAVLGIGGALLWGVVMALLSLLPMLGAALVWVPVALYLLATGAFWHGVLLIAWGVLVIGLVDNLLRPILVGKDTRLPDYVVLLSTLGGLVTFGMNGFVLGPVIAAMFVAVWHIHGSAGR